MPRYFFYTMVQKSQKWPKTQIKGGPALNSMTTRNLQENFHIFEKLMNSVFKQNQFWHN